MTNEQKMAYALGYNIGMNVGGDLKAKGANDLDLNQLAEAFKAGFAGEQPSIDMNEAIELLNNYLQEKQNALVEEQTKEAKSFFTQNGLRAEVTTTASGLQYEVLTPAAGEKPAASSTVAVHYHGTLLDGTVFDSSVERGQPAQFGVNQVIPGWVEGLQLMEKGSKYKFYIPQDLAYGERGAGTIPPFSPLVFEVELLEVM